MHDKDRTRGLIRFSIVERGWHKKKSIHPWYANISRVAHYVADLMAFRASQLDAALSSYGINFLTSPKSTFGSDHDFNFANHR